MTRLRFGICPIEGGHFFREALEEVERAEELGFDSVWMEEHHGVPDHYWPSPIRARRLRHSDLARAARRQRVRLPLLPPGAARRGGGAAGRHLDGRRSLGVAIGYKPDEFAPLRRRPREARRALRGAARHHEGALDAGRRDAPGRALHGDRRAARAEARPAAAPAGVDRRLGRRDPAARGHARRRLDPRAHRRPAAAPARARRSSSRIGGPPGCPRPTEWPVTRDCDHRRDRAGGARAGRAAPHGGLRQGVRRGLEAPVHRRRDRDRPRPPDGGPLPHRHARPDRAGSRALRRAVRHDPPDLPALLPRHAARGRSCASSSSWRARSCRRSASTAL